MDFYNMPAAAPPPGVIPNFDSPPSLKGELLIINVVFTTVMAIFVAVRLISRGFIVKQVGIDDYFCAIAALASISHTVVIREQSRFGYGFHLWDIRASTVMEAVENRILLANNFPYMVCLLFGKLSILLLFSRLFSVSPRTNIVIIGVMIFTTAYTVSILCVSIASFVKCGSLENMTTDFCIAMGTSISIVQSAINVITDFLILFIPLPMTLALSLPLRKKLAVSSVFLTGLLACAASIGRLVSAVKTLHAEDIMWIQAKNDIFTIIEMNAVIIASCLLTLPTFLRRCKKWASQAYSSMVSHHYSSSNRSMHKLPDHEHEFKPVPDRPRAAPKPPKDPYPMVTLTNITLMSQDAASKDSVEQKERQCSIEQVESYQRSSDVRACD
ncbi:hypothetical protein GQ43DRAFT_439862 [Delitschia confertaspora ATCC 74209]|uniref:Rhodopsin domain-containing protein n=1 Tax=Delitschia confertaspora ATCC 74209 TaxID=1513339 RepID=A0A9P4JMK0_9PLEO|nr:hypothetical protein GQ43DRAFT_439862 [Delitschia confertaspora ATCC 74209]